MDEFDVYNAHAPYEDQMWDEALKRVERGEKVSFVPATAENIPGRSRSWGARGEGGQGYGPDEGAGYGQGPGGLGYGQGYDQGYGDNPMAQQLLFSGSAVSPRYQMLAENAHGQPRSMADASYGNPNQAGSANESSSSPPTSFGGIKLLSDWKILQNEKANYQDRPPQTQDAWTQGAQAPNGESQVVQTAEAKPDSSEVWGKVQQVDSSGKPLPVGKLGKVEWSSPHLDRTP